jgi:hypothetical protein
MKKILDLVKKVALAIVVLAIIGVVFGGRGNKSGSDSTDSAKTEASESAKQEEKSEEKDEKQDEEKAAEEEPAQEEAPAEEEDGGPELATDADYSVTINGYNIVEDYDGSPAIAIDYTFTNVKDDSPSSMQFATDITVYQDGVECEDAYFSGENSDGYTNKVKKGVSVEVTRAYKLQNTTSDVEVEVGQLSFWDDALLAYEVFQLS